MLVPLLFNTFINDIILTHQNCELANYADDSTMYSFDKNIDNNYDLTESGVCYLSNFSLMLYGVNDELQTDLVSENVTTENSKEEKVLGITIDSKLDFMHLTSITKKANIKLNVLTRVQKYMTPEQKAFLTPSFRKSQFNYCPLIWMFCSKKALHRLNIITKNLCALYIKFSNFIALLVNANEKSVHQACLEFPMIEVYKYLNGLSPQIMNDIFKLRKYICNLRHFHLFESQNPRT